MFCSQCGQRVTEGARFCNHCGAIVAAPAAAAPPPAMTASTGAAAPALSADPPPAPTPAAEPRAAPAFTSAATSTSDASSGAAPASPAAPSGTPSAGATPSFDARALAQGLIARVKAIILTPSTEWPLIASEPSSARAIYLYYVAPLAAIGVIATFIGHSLVGVSVPLFGTLRVPVAAGLATAVVSYALTFVVVFVISWLVDALAPTFDGQKDPLAALKVTAYAYTPAWVAGVLNLLPALGVVGGLIGLYGLYLLYTGLPVLMRCPKDKSIGYTIVLVLCAIVMSIVIGFCSAIVVGGLGFAGLGATAALGKPGMSDRAATDAAAGMLSGIFGGKSDAERAKVGDALKTLEKLGAQSEQADKAAKAGAPNAPAVDMNAALGAVGAIMAGGKDVQPVDFHKLRELMPESLPGMSRNELSGQSGEAMGIKGSSATARYSGGDGSITIEITDLGSLSGLAGLANKFDPNLEKETETGYERTRRVNDQLVHERYDRRGKYGEVSVVAGNRFSITVQGSGVEPDALSVALKQIDLGRLAVLATAAK